MPVWLVPVAQETWERSGIQHGVVRGMEERRGGDWQVPSVDRGAEADRIQQGAVRRALLLAPSKMLLSSIAGIQVESVPNQLQSVRTGRVEQVGHLASQRHGHSTVGVGRGGGVEFRGRRRVVDST